MHSPTRSRNGGPIRANRAWTLFALTLVSVLLLTAMGASSAMAQRRSRRTRPEPGVAVSVSPNPARTDSPFAYLFELRATGWESPEVVADRRLLSFVVHTEGRRRPTTCRHPDAPRSLPTGRIRTLGGDAPTVWRETIDLRMYCWGRALDALTAGARVEVRYGFGRRRRGTWVARERQRDGSGDVTERREGRHARQSASSLVGADFSFSALANANANPDTTTTTTTDSPAETQVSISMGSIDASRGASVTFRPRIRATAGAVRVYVRDDLFRFAIRGPLGEHICAMERTPIAPIIDFFSRLRGRRTVGGRISVALVCRDAFMVAGIYEVTPMVDLVYGAGQYNLDDVVTGTFTGDPVLVRIRRSARGYLEQVPAGPGSSNGSPDES